MKPILSVLVACAAATALLAQVVNQENENPDRVAVKASQVPWGALNPARGDKGPRAGALWSDRTTEAASGFLVRFADGFSSPPHIHNVTYRGVVLGGRIHNDDPEAEEMWMPPGSFWTQPAGEVHITAAQGEDAMAYIEIDAGPYLVMPEEEAFDEGERPVNVVPSNLVWLDSEQCRWIDGAASGQAAGSPEVAFLWGEPASDSRSGSFLRLPMGFTGGIRSDGGLLRVVVVTGEVGIQNPPGETVEDFAVGEYFEVPAGGQTSLNTGGQEACILYLQAEGSYRIVVAE